MPRTLAIALALASQTIAFTATWELDGAHSNVQFSVRHMMVTNVRGRFATVTGTAEADEADLTRSKITATIDTASIDTGNAKRDEHLRNADFLDVAKFPKMTFTSTKIEKAGEGRWKVTGDLSLHGVTKAVVLDVEGPTPEVKDPWGNTKVGASATAKINRKDFGIEWNKALESGGLLVGEEVSITIDAEAQKKK